MLTDKHNEASLYHIAPARDRKYKLGVLGANGSTLTSLQIPAGGEPDRDEWDWKREKERGRERERKREREREKEREKERGLNYYTKPL